MMKLFKTASILWGFRFKSSIQYGVSHAIVAGLFIALVMVPQAWAIDLNRSATNPAPAAKSTNGAPDLDQLTRDLQRFLGGARAAALQRGAGQKAAVNTVKDPATNAQPSWWVTAAENGTARQIKRVGRPVVSSPVQAKAKRTEAETMTMIRSFLSSQSPALKLQDPNAELALVSSETDSLGYRHFRYTQKLEAIPVWPTGLTVHLAPDGELHLITASIVPTPSAVSRVPGIEADKAVERAKAKVPGGFRGTHTTPELILHWDSDATATPVRLAWKFRVSVGEHASWTAIMDAQTGGEISIQSDARTGSVMGSGTDLFGVTKTFPVWEQGGVYYMIDTTKSSSKPNSDPLIKPVNVIGVKDAAGMLFEEIDLKPLGFVSSKQLNQWVPPEAVSLFNNLAATRDYYKIVHNRDDVFGSGGNQIGFIRIGGYKSASYQSAQGRMLFGDGDTYAKSLDVVAHEITHGVVDFSCGLIYSSQSGALNEAFSDIFGEMTERYHYGSNDWIIGTHLNGKLRSLKDPKSFSHPSKMSEFVRMTSDNGGVHINSGVINHAFYLLAAGMVNSVGFDAAEKIFYRCLTVHLNAQSKFIDCRLGCVQSALELYPQDRFKQNAVEVAFDQVEVFDGVPTPPPVSYPPVNANDSLLVTYRKSTGGSYSIGRREESLMDHLLYGSKIVATNVSEQRVSVAGDGSIFIFIGADNDLYWNSTEFPEKNLKRFGIPGFVHSAAVSPDGLSFAIVPNNLGEIWVINNRSDQVKKFKLVTSSYDSDSLGKILEADRVCFSPDGSKLAYDASFLVDIANSAPEIRWRTFILDVETESAYCLVSNDRFNIGNPVFSRVSERYIGLDYQDTASGKYGCLIWDLLSYGPFFNVADNLENYSFLDFTGDGDSVLYIGKDAEAKISGTSVYRRSIDYKAKASGNPERVFLDAERVANYRRGTFRVKNDAPFVTWTNPASGTSVAVGASVTLAVSAVDQDGIDRVEFWQGGKMLGEVMQPGEVPQPSFSLSVPMTTPGTFGIVARAFDTYGASADSASIQVTVVPALFAKVADQAVDEGIVFRLDLGSAAGTKPGLAFSLVSGPSGLSISPAGVLTWTPTEDQGPSLASVEIAATDGISRITDRFSVQVREVNQPPVLSPVSTLNAKAGIELNYTLQASDPDRPAQGLSFALESGPSGLTVSSGGAVRWTPTLSQSSTVQAVTVSVSDGVLKATTQFSIQVGSDPLPVSPTNVVWSVEGIAGNFIETPDGNVVAGGNRMVRCFSGGDGKELWRVPAPDNNDTAVWEFLPGYIDDDGAVIGKYKMEVLNPTYAVNHGLFVVETAGGVLRLSTSLLSTNTDYNPYGAIRGLRHRELMLQSSTGVGVYEIGKGFRWKRSDFRLNPDQWIPVDNLLVHSDTQPNFIGTVLFAYDLSNGNLRWTSRLPGSFSVNQLLFDGVSRIIVAKRETVHAVDVFSGQELWRQGGGFSGENSLVILSDHKSLDRFYYFQGQTTGYANFIDIRLGQNRFNPLQGNVNGQWLGGFGFTGGAILSTGSRIVKINSVGTNAWPFLAQGEYIASIGSSGINWSFPVNNDTAWLYSVLANGRLLVSDYTDGKLMALQGEGAGLSADSPWPHRLRTTPRFGNYGVLGLGSADSGLTSLYSFDGHSDDLVSACDAPEGAVGSAGYEASGGPRRGYLKPDRGGETRFDSGFMRTNSTSKSLAVWVRLPDFSAGSVKLLDGGDEDPSGFAGMNLTASAAASGTLVTFNLGAGTSASWQSVAATTPKRPRQWVHVTAVINDSGVQQLYLDGVLAASAAGRSSKAISRTSTAAMTLPAAVGFDDLRTYLRTVTADEVAQIYAAADPMVEPPVIVTQPVASSVNAGATVAFSVFATGTAPLYYQWRKNGGVLAGQTNATLTLTQVQPANSGDYSVVVGNSAGSVTSALAALTVNTQPAFVGIKAASVAEGSELSVQLVTADSDLPAQKLTVRLLSGPSGLVVNPQGLVSWIPTEAQGPMPHTVNVEVSDGSLTATNEFIVTVLEVNRPPVINPVAAASIAEGTAWSQALGASDPDLPPNGLTFRLVNGPSGASVDSKSGVLSWTPSETDGGSTVDFVVEVADDGQPALASQTTVRLTVTEVNSPPTLAALADVTMPEGAAWSMSIRATDSDLPAQSLAYGLKANPAGMTFNPSTGELRWIPSESQGPGTYPVTVSVTDSGGATAERSFTVTVAEVNQPPQVAAWADQRIVFGQSVSLKMDVTDSDLPVNRLTYRVVNGPSTMVLSDDGQLAWTPTRNQAPSTNLISIAVSDGTVSVTNSVRIEVFELVMAVNGTEAMETVNASLNPRISFRCGRPDWLVFYSLNGQTPTSDAPSKFYQDPFVLPATATVWPIAFSPDFSDSILGLPVRVAVLKTQTLTVQGGMGLVHRGPGVPIEVKSDSGLPVSLAVISGPARSEAGQLVPIGGGVVRIRATQAGNDSWAPAEAQFERTVARASQTFVWQSLDTAVFGAAPLRLRAIASSGLPVDYTVVSGPGSVAGDLLQLNGAGTVVLRARQAGTADFEAAVTDLSVPVAKATQTLTWDGVSDRPFSSEVILLTGKASSGLGVTYDVISGPAAASDDRLTLTGVGTVVIRASQAGDANYLPAPVRQVSFVVSKAAQTLAFGSIGSKTFGDGSIMLSTTSSAGLPVTYRVVSGPGFLVGNQLSLTGAGEVVIQASQSGNDLYQAASVAQSVTVAKAMQSLSWSPDSSLTYRTNLIALDAKASSGLPVAYRIVSGPGAIVAGQISLTGIGSVVISAEQSGDANWLAATSITNRFTVGRGVQVVTFDPIGDQTLGSGSVKLAARTSSGLAVTFSVISGPATVDNDQLIVSAEGLVTVRAINPGSPLWLSASVDQSFRVVSLGAPPQVVIKPPTGDGSFGLEVMAPVGINLVLEATSDLSAWTETQSIIGQGSVNPVKITLQTDPNVQAKFWRVRVR
jgi:bacillolysin